MRSQTCNLTPYAGNSNEFVELQHLHSIKAVHEIVCMSITVVFLLFIKERIPEEQWDSGACDYEKPAENLDTFISR